MDDKHGGHVGKRLVAAADGSALGNPGPAGWAWYIDENRWAAGGWERGTNNMGELMAVLDLLRATRDAGPLTVLCDSQYVINSVTKWMPGWKRKGWKKGDGKPVLNVEFMQGIDAELNGGTSRDVVFEWVKGHSGHPLNEAADRLANGAAVTFSTGGVPEAGPGLGGRVLAASPAPAGFGRPAGAGEQGALLDVPEPDELDRVIDLERALLEGEVRSSPRMMERLLHPEWVEFGASGEVIDRESAVAGPGPADTDLEVIESVRLAEDVVLLLWRGRSDHETRLRSSLWVREGDRWRQRFHQGTAE